MANKLVAIQVEGVLRKPVGGAPIEQGIDLYYGLATRGKIVLLTSQHEQDRELKQWLEMQGMSEHHEIRYFKWVYDLNRNLVEQQLTGLLQPGLVVTPDPGTAAVLVEAGYNTLTFTHAEYADPTWRPDAEFKLRAWDSLSEQVAREAYLKTKDERKEVA